MTRISLHNTPDPLTIVRTDVHFPSNGAELHGILFTPADQVTPLPTVVVTGAWTSVKEQMSGTYARELARAGCAALAFDHTGWGASGGEPRYLEDPATKTSDILAAVDFLTSHPLCDANQLYGLGICASAGYMATAAADHRALTKIALVAPWLHNPEIAEQIYGGPEPTKDLIEAGRSAEAAAQPCIIPAASDTNEPSLMTDVPYYTDTARGGIPSYDNAFNVASWEPWLTYDAHAAADRLAVPTLVVTSDTAALPDGARAFINRTTAPVTEFWFDGASQDDFYDNTDVVGDAVDAVVKHFAGEFSHNSLSHGMDTALDNKLRARAFFAAVEALDATAVAFLFAEDGTQRNPYHCGVFTAGVRGRDEIDSYWADTFNRVESIDYDIHEMQAMEDPSMVFVHFTGAVELPDGADTYENQYYATFRFNPDGEITEYVEIFNPVVAARAFNVMGEF